jgi:sporulation protein YlmC with PRC-barrel domain
MAYLSEFIHKPVIDSLGKKIGMLEDLILSAWIDQVQPAITALIVRQGAGSIALKIDNVDSLKPSGIVLKSPESDASSYQLQRNDLYLAGEVLDHPVISRLGAQMARANDLEICWEGQQLIVSRVLIGTKGLLIRLGFLKIVEPIAQGFHRSLPEGAASWEDLILATPEVLGQERKLLAMLHPADIAKILCDSTPMKSSLYLEILGSAQIAGALERIRSNAQKDLFILIPEEKRLSVLEHMAPEKATGLLSSFPSDMREDLLRSMDGRAAREILKISAYPSKTAGSMMTTKFTMIRQELTVEAAAQFLRQTGKRQAIDPFLFVTNPQNQLVGVLPLAELFCANQEITVSELVQKPVIYAEIANSPGQVLQRLLRYGLIVIPVVNEHHLVVGVVHLENCLRQLFSPSWRGHLTFPND